MGLLASRGDPCGAKQKQVRLVPPLTTCHPHSLHTRQALAVQVSLSRCCLGDY